jgi:hypothetical protein
MLFGRAFSTDGVEMNFIGIHPSAEKNGRMESPAIPKGVLLTPA